MDLNLAVLFPAAHVVRHLVSKVNLFLEVLVHLSFDGVRLALCNKSTAVVDTAHRIEVLVIGREAAHDIELGVEDVLAVATVLDAVVNDQLNQDFFGILAVERQVLTVAADDLAVLAEALLYTSSPVRGVMLDQASWSDVLGVIFGGLSNLGAPAQRLDGLLALKEVNRALDSLGTFFGPESDLALSLQQHTVELAKHGLEVLNEELRVLPDVVMHLENLLVKCGDVGVWE